MGTTDRRGADPASQDGAAAPTGGPVEGGKEAPVGAEVRETTPDRTDPAALREAADDAGRRIEGQA
jgi:hypothetical protein